VKPLRLMLERLQQDADCTIGSLSIEDEGHFCWTLEDPVRPDRVKIHGETAIPVGHYTVDITMSPRFKRPLPLLISVPMFSGIRIHPGNNAGDTEGCILVGMDRYAKSIGRSRVAFDALFARLQKAHKVGIPITIDIVRNPP
jgi:hypothetical protein